VKPKYIPDIAVEWLPLWLHIQKTLGHMLLALWVLLWFPSDSAGTCWSGFLEVGHDNLHVPSN